MTATILLLLHILHSESSHLDCRESCLEVLCMNLQKRRKNADVRPKSRRDSSRHNALDLYRETLHSNLCRDNGYPNRVFVVVLGPSRQLPT
jgi:protein involved in temperature-dependent protein secretion